MRLKIAVLPGDGIGPEIIRQARKVVNAIANKFNHSVEWNYGLTGADAIKKLGAPYPDETHKICIDSDAVLFGAVGDLKFDNDVSAKSRPEDGLLLMRKKLGLYANIRPIITFPSLIKQSPLKENLIKNVNFLFFRELTSGIYFGEKGRKNNGKTAYDVCTYHYDEILRIMRLAYQYAMKREKKICIVDKANVLETSRLWREIGQNVAKEFKKVKTEFLFVDAAAMKIIQSPENFDIIVTENMFGDILTDEASVISGSIGLIPSASIGLYTSVFEPIHGSYPQVAGKNIANPIGTILSAAMMFEYAFNLKNESNRIIEIVNQSIEEKILTKDIAYKGDKISSTDEVGDWISKKI